MNKKRNLLWYSRMFLIGLWFAIVSIIVFFISLFRIRNPKNNQMLAHILTPVARKILGIKVNVQNAFLTHQNHPCIIVMNHQAALDILVAREVLPSRCIVIAKKQLAFIPVFGQILYLGKNILINKTNHKQSIQKINQANFNILKDNLSVFIFPEGTRNYSCGLKKFKKGAFRLAIENQFPIVPVVVSNYAQNIDFTKFHAGNIMVVACPAIPTLGLKQEDINTLLIETEKVMLATMMKLEQTNLK